MKSCLPLWNYRSADFNFTNKSPWFSSFLVAAIIFQLNPAGKQNTQEFRISEEIRTPYAGDVGHIRKEEYLKNFN
jgi:hypothetical protein